MRNIISPCRIGNSSVCPKRSWKLASIENTDPSLTLKFCAYLFAIISVLKNSIFVNLSIFLSMSILRPWSARLVACQTFWSTGAPYWTWRCAWSWYSWTSSRSFQSSIFQHRTCFTIQSCKTAWSFGRLGLTIESSITCKSLTSLLYWDSLNSMCKLKAQQTPVSVITGVNISEQLTWADGCPVAKMFSKVICTKTTCWFFMFMSESTWLPIHQHCLSKWGEVEDEFLEGKQGRVDFQSRRNRFGYTFESFSCKTVQGNGPVTWLYCCWRSKVPVE